MSALRPLGLLLLLSCAGASPTVISGESLDALGNQFADLSPIMDEGLKSGAISPAQYDVYKEFGTRFQASYPLARDLWKAARKVEDAATANKIEAVIQGFMAEMSTIFADAMTAKKAFAAKKLDGGV